MMLDEIAGYLAENGIGTWASTLFKGSMPETPDDVVCIYENAGKPPEFTFANGVMAEEPGLQAIARSKSYSAARAKIESIVQLLSGKSNVSIGGRFYYLIAAAQMPSSLGTDENGRRLVSVNFNVMRQA